MPLFRSQKRQYNRRRKGLLAILLPWMRRFGFALAAVTGVIWLGSWLWLSGAVHKAIDGTERAVLLATADAGFAVENVLIEGRVHSDPDVLRGLLNVRRGDPLLSLDPDAAKDLIERISWVRHAHVERRFPDTVYIALQERLPVAVWREDGTERIIDEGGEPIASDTLASFEDLIRVSGTSSHTQAPDMLALLRAEPDIYRRIVSARYMNERRWDLKTQSDIIIKLPEKDVGLALRKLAQAHEDNAILDVGLVSIDLRAPDRLVLRTKPGAVQEYKAMYGGREDAVKGGGI